MEAELLSQPEVSVETISIERGHKVMHPWYFVKKLVSLGMYDERPDDVIADMRHTEKFMGRMKHSSIMLKFPKPVELGVKIQNVKAGKFEFIGVLPISRTETDDVGVYECVYDHGPLGDYNG